MALLSSLSLWERVGVRGNSSRFIRYKLLRQNPLILTFSQREKGYKA
jgi:hypothetical protein